MYGKCTRYRVQGMPGVKDRSFDALQDAKTWLAQALTDARRGEFVHRATGPCSSGPPGAGLAPRDRGGVDHAEGAGQRKKPAPGAAKDVITSAITQLEGCGGTGSVLAIVGLLGALWVASG